MARKIRKAKELKVKIRETKGLETIRSFSGRNLLVHNRAKEFAAQGQLSQ
jgi:hypothetical protein